MSQCTIVPQSLDGLYIAVEAAIRNEGNGADLNHIDVSRILILDGLFDNSPFNGDISGWDVSNARSMDCMFQHSAFNGDISRWNVSKVHTMRSMFKQSRFTGSLAHWDVGRVQVMNHMFYASVFNGDLSEWRPQSLTHATGMFEDSPFNGDVSNWCPAKLRRMKEMFLTRYFHGDLSRWQLSNTEECTQMFHRDFGGRLPHVECESPHEMYTDLFGGSQWAAEHMARAPFYKPHADMLQEAPHACRWASPQTVQWAHDMNAMGQTMGLNARELRSIMLEHPVGIEVPLGPSVDCQVFDSLE